MKQPSFSLKWNILSIFLIYSTSFTATTQSFMIPRSSLSEEAIKHHRAYQQAASDTDDFKTFYYNQTLDHFNYKPESYTKFKQRYAINFKYWGGADSKAPIFVLLGAEAAIDLQLKSRDFLTDNAASFKALIVYTEHRYYGKSVPFGLSWQEAISNPDTVGYFNSAQALADYAEILLHIKKTLNARYSPVIVIGGSYGGMLATWFRLKYPHVAHGALASSAPLLYFDKVTPHRAYMAVVTKDFREASETCYETIRKSWSEINRLASKPKGLSILSKKFNTCSPLKSGDHLRDALIMMYSVAAQYNSPPEYPVSKICGAIDGASSAENDILSKIYAGVVAYYENTSCQFGDVVLPYSLETSWGWHWQVCSDIVIAYGTDGNDSMFSPQPFHIRNYTKGCKELFTVTPRFDWATTYYGGHDIELVLKRFGSNIIFSNGLKDPYSSGGVLHSISDSIIALTTVNGSHCLDILGARKGDPEWLVHQRNEEINIIEGWIKQYYSDLQALHIA